VAVVVEVSLLVGGFGRLSEETVVDLEVVVGVDPAVEVGIGFDRAADEDGVGVDRVAERVGDVAGVD
jgi:hypothetical protein